MMLFALSLVKSTNGAKNIGSHAGSSSSKRRSCPIRKRIGRPQQAHSESMSKDRDSFLKRPCTKGVATASVPQAAQSRSPLEKASLWGVGSAVIG